jgi:starvation-inducible DNA-binding protein
MLNPKINMTFNNTQTEEFETDRTTGFLNTLLANELVMALNTRNAFWNLDGPHFISLYLLFQNQYKILDNQIDDLASRIQSLGYNVLAGLGDISANTAIQTNSYFENEEAMISSLIMGHEKVCTLISSYLNTLASIDFSTRDMLIFIQTRHVTMIGKLREQIGLSV